MGERETKQQSVSLPPQAGELASLELHLQTDLMHRNQQYDTNLDKKTLTNTEI